MPQVLLNSNDISSKIVAISGMNYIRNDNFSFELPEISIETTIATGQINDNITCIIAENLQADFYISDIKYNYASHLYTWVCPHAFVRLSDYRASQISQYWPDVTPTYAQFNNDQSYHGLWSRQYWQLLFLVQTLIHHATGCGCANIDVSVGADESVYYTRAFDGYFWTTTQWNWDQIGISIPTLRRIGSKRHDDYQSDVYDIFSNLPTALDVLNYCCMTLGMQIDIFSSNYKITPVSNQMQIPTESIQIDKDERNLELYRFYESKTSRLIADSFDYIYGYWDEGNNYIPYTFGFDGADYQLTESNLYHEDSLKPGRRKLAVAWPKLWNIHYISSNYIAIIRDSENDLRWWDMWFNSILIPFWASKSIVQSYTTPISDQNIAARSVNIDIGNSRKMKYEVFS